jgi:L,D-transpeptidase catalytic domain
LLNKLNPRICFLIDMEVSSGSKRFFVYNMVEDTVVASGLVTHGRCNELWLEGRKYSNEVGSGCTSPGRYKIGHKYSGRFGLAYKLHGLDSSNSNAYRRYVVLHGHECVPEAEVEPYPICQSDGCPTVSERFLKTLAGYIDGATKPILLWIYE